MGSGAWATGNALETAVEMIETAILKTDRAFSLKELQIEPKRIITVDGVRHEIDLWVRIIDPNDYDSLFLFECKNWKDKVGKNEVIILEEKVKVANAQRGFIVAHHFTEDARRQATKSGRIKLLECRQLSSNELPTLITHLHGIWTKNRTISCRFEAADPSSARQGEWQAQFIRYQGQSISLKDYMLTWANEAFQKSLRGYPSALLTAGEYPHCFSDSRVFPPSQFYLEDQAMKAGSISCEWTLVIERAVITSKLAVNHRGRAFQGLIRFPNDTHIVDIAGIDKIVSGTMSEADRSGYMRIVRYEGPPNNSPLIS